MKPIVGLIGYARSGKDTAAQVLLDHGWLRAAFADQLKADVEKCVGCPLRGPGADATQKELWRPLLVEYGRLRRQQHPDYWIWQLEANMKMACGPQDKVVITDVRYANEANWILAKGGILIFVDRPGTKAANEEEKESICAIWSDNALVDRISLAVNNDTIKTLHDDVFGIVQYKLGKV